MCVVDDPNSNASAIANQRIYYDLRGTYLDAGPSLSLQGPGGTLAVARVTVGGVNIGYSSVDIPISNLQTDSYTFSGTGGFDIAAFSAPVKMFAPLVWTNYESLQTINRADGMTVMWSGGDPSQPVFIRGGSAGLDPTTLALTVASFTCLADQKAGSFTVPASILNRLPPSSKLSGYPVPGDVIVSHGSARVRASVPGVDYFYLSTSSSEVRPATFQ